MAETLISPGVLARENDQSQVTSQPIQAGAAIVGPTVLGSVNIPKLVTSYSEYLANFGSTFSSGSDEYTYFTSISAYNYFQNGGTSLIVNRVASGSWTPATSSVIQNDVTSTALNPSPYNFTGSAGITGRGGTAGTFSAVASTKDGGASDATFNVVRGTSIGKIYNGTANTVGTAGSFAALVAAGTNPVDCLVSTVFGSSTPISVTGGTGTGATVKVTTGTDLGTQRGTITEIEVISGGTGYIAGDIITIPAGSLGSGMIKVAAKSPDAANTVGTATPGTQVLTEGTSGAGSNTYSVANGTASSKGSGATFNCIFNSSAGKLIQSTTITGAGSALTGATASQTATGLTLANLISNGGNIANGGAGGTFSLDLRWSR